MNKNENTSDRYFRLTNFYAAAFLFTQGLVLVNMEEISPGKSQFVFEDCPNRELLLQQYNFAPENASACLVDVRKFIYALKTLKERLHNRDF